MEQTNLKSFLDSEMFPNHWVTGDMHFLHEVKQAEKIKQLKAEIKKLKAKIE